MADSNKDNVLLQKGGELFLEKGATGTWITGGFISHEEYNQNLLWRRGIDIFDQMRKSDGSIQALLKVCKHPILAAAWNVEAASDDEFDQYVKRFVENELFKRNVNWPQFLRDVLGKLEFGFSCFEKTYEITEFEQQTRIGLMNLGWRKQWSILRWETNEGEPGVTQQLLGDLVSIPQDKILLFTNDREGDNYQGVSLLRYVYKDWDIKHRIENLMSIAAERSLGVPIVEKSPDISSADEKKMREVMRNFRSNHQQYIEYTIGTTKLDWMKIETNIKTDLIPMLEYLQHEIDKSILAQFLDLAGSRSGGSSGSHALSADQSQLFEKALEAVAKEIEGVLNSDLVQQLCDLNFSDLPNGYPSITFDNLGDENLSQMADYLNKLAQVDLVTPDPDLENRLRQIAAIPNLPDDIYENYDQRITAQTQALPLTPLGPGQTPQPPAPTGKPKRTGSSKLPENQSKDTKDKPTPETNSQNRPYKSPSTEAAIKATQDARKVLIQDIMAQ